MKIPFTLHLATDNDIDDIQGLLYPHYFEESHYSDLTYSAKHTRRTIEGFISNNCILAKVSGKLCGIISSYFINSYYEEIEADIDLMFVLPECRGTGISRAMVKKILEHADLNGVAIVYTSCASGISDKNEKLYSNLFGKFGFKPLGTELIRRK